MAGRTGDDAGASETIREAYLGGIATVSRGSALNCSDMMTCVASDFQLADGYGGRKPWDERPWREKGSLWSEALLFYKARGSSVHFLSPFAT